MCERVFFSFLFFFFDLSSDWSTHYLYIITNLQPIPLLSPTFNSPSIGIEILDTAHYLFRVLYCIYIPS